MKVEVVGRRERERWRIEERDVKFEREARQSASRSSDKDIPLLPQAQSSSRDFKRKPPPVISLVPFTLLDKLTKLNQFFPFNLNFNLPSLLNRIIYTSPSFDYPLNQ